MRDRGRKEEVVENIAQAIEALESYDLERTKEALHYLIRAGELRAIEHILPLTQHPDVALRHFAKKLFGTWKAASRQRSLNESWPPQQRCLLS